MHSFCDVFATFLLCSDHGQKVVTKAPHVRILLHTTTALKRANGSNLGELVTVKPLSEKDAMALLSSLVPTRLLDDETALARIAKACDNVPLLLSLVADALASGFATCTVRKCKDASIPFFIYSTMHFFTESSSVPVCDGIHQFRQFVRVQYLTDRCMKWQQ